MLCIWTTGIQTRLPTVVNRDETTPAETPIEDLNQAPETSPLSPLIECTPPETEDDDQCVTVVTLLKSSPLIKESSVGVEMLRQRIC